MDLLIWYAVVAAIIFRAKVLSQSSSTTASSSSTASSTSSATSTSSTTSSSSSTSTCKAGWESAGQFCYRTDKTMFRNLDCAKTYCTNMGGQLPELPAQTDSDAFATWWQGKNSFRSAWLGMAGPGTGDTSNKASWKWLSGTDIAYDTSWAPGFPLNIVTYSCSYLYWANKLWYSDVCSSLRGVACQYDPSKGLATTGKCDPGYTEVSTSCYKIENLRTYKAAYDTCAKEGARMAEFASESDYNSFNTVWQGSCNKQGIVYWLGLRTLPSNKPRYDTSWTWADGTKLAFTPPWSALYPTQFQDCASVMQLGTKYEWTNLFDCRYDAGRQTVCHYVQADGRCIKCETGWILVGKSCYKNETSRLAYDAGKTTCEGLKGTLPVFAASDEYYQLLSYMKLTPESDFWMGLEPSGSTLDSKSSSWKWIDGTALSFPFMENSLLKISSYPYKCIFAETTVGKWQNNHPCTTVKPVICQTKANTGCITL